MQTTFTLDQAPDAMAEIFWLAFTQLSEREKQAVLHKFKVAVGTLPTQTVKTAHIAHTLVGLVAWGGDALEDSERLYDQ